jgi:hypothetical protein
MRAMAKDQIAIHRACVAGRSERSRPLSKGYHRESSRLAGAFEFLFHERKSTMQILH